MGLTGRDDETINESSVISETGMPYTDTISKYIRDLPKVQWSNILKEVIVLEALNPDDIAAVFRIVQQCCKSARNVGEDEFQERSHLEKLLINYDGVVVRIKATPSDVSDIIAFVLVHPSIRSRQIPPNNAQVRIFTNDEYVNIYEDLIAVSEEILLSDNTFYDGSLFYVFRKCDNEINILRKCGYIPMCCLPLGGNLVHQKPSFSIIFYKYFTRKSMQTVTPAIKNLYRNKYLHMLKLNDKLTQFDARITMKSLPHAYDFRCGLQTTISEVSVKETRKLYELFLENLRESNGFSEDDIWSFEYFIYDIIKPFYSMIITTRDGHNTIVAYIGFNENLDSRGAKGKTIDAIILVNPEFRNRGIGVEGQTIIDRIACYDYGFSGTLSDTPIGNHRVHDIVSRHGYTNLGYLPRSIHLQGKAATDVAMNYLAYSNLRHGPLVGDTWSTPTVPSKL